MGRPITRTTPRLQDIPIDGQPKQILSTPVPGAIEFHVTHTLSSDNIVRTWLFQPADMPMHLSYERNARKICYYRFEDLEENGLFDIEQVPKWCLDPSYSHVIDRDHAESHLAINLLPSEYLDILRQRITHAVEAEQTLMDDSIV